MENAFYTMMDSQAEILIAVAKKLKEQMQKVMETRKIKIV